MQKTIQIDRRVCPQCLGLNLVTDANSGEVVCGDCGLVLAENMLNRSPEWRAYTLEEKQSNSRTGSPVSYARFDKGLHTTISGFTDASGNRLSANAKRRASENGT